MDVKSIFSRHLSNVKDLHDSIRKDVLALDQMLYSVRFGDDPPEFPTKIPPAFETAQTKNTTLLDVILVGPKLKVMPQADYVAYKKSVLKALEAGDDELPPAVNQYKVFDHTEISAVKAGYKWVKSMRDTSYWEIIANEFWPRPQHLELFSGKIEAPSTLLAVKYLWLFNEYDKDAPFEGILPNTQPVRNALQWLFGTTFGNQRGSAIRSTMQQHRMAAELCVPGMDAFMLNSVLWMMGQTDV